MSATGISAAVAGLELVIQMIDRLAAASAAVKKAHAEGRGLTSEELKAIRGEGDALLVLFDEEIAKAKAEGR